MEPADLNSSRDDARLAALLRAGAAPIPDDGFSARVLETLPPRRGPAARGAPLAATLAGAAGLALALAKGGSLAAFLPVAELAGDTLIELARAPWTAFAVLVAIASAVHGVRTARAFARR